jgi:hypothetical protein
MIKVDYKGIDDFVAKYDHMEFEGWKVHVLTPDHAGWMKRAGVMKNNSWFVKEVIEPDENGFWNFKEKHVDPRRTRS